MSQQSSGSASSSSDEKSLHIITQIIDTIGQLLKAQSPKASPETELENANSRTKVACCRETRPPQLLDPHLELQNELQKAERGLKYMPRAFSKLKNKNWNAGECLEREFQGQMKSFLDQIKPKVPHEKMEKDMDETSKKIEVHLFNETLAKVQQRIVSLMTASDPHPSDAQGLYKTIKFEDYFLVGEKKQGEMKKEIRESLAFKSLCEDFLGVFETLDRKTKLCLLCFSALPEDAVVKKRALLHWWIGEGVIGSDDGAHVEASKVLKNLVTKGFIQPDLKKRRMVGFKMDRLVRAVVVTFAEKLGFLSFDHMGVPNADFSWSHRVCLVEGEKEPSRQVLMRNDKQEELEKLHTIFNVNDHQPDFKKLWFSKLKNLNVLCLGGWQGLDCPHIEVTWQRLDRSHSEGESMEFLGGLKIMKYLKLLSLQGISRITELPNSLCKLNSLLILDLKACHNLELLPKNLKALKNLTHLDMSECYMLDHVPQGLGNLKELQVLKGFLLGDSASKNQCHLGDLRQLKKLRKLSINTIREDFPTREEVSALQSFEVLENLTLTWGEKPSTEDAPRIPTEESEAKATRMGRLGKRQHEGKSPAQPSVTAQSAQPGTLETPASTSAPSTKTLQKLELHCFPGTEPPKWLTEGQLKPEKKLYISRGNLQSLCKVNDVVNKWSVKILRLKYLKGLKMDWFELKNSFKELVYLEMVQCLKLTLFPCDVDGLWLNLPGQDKKLEELELGLTWSFLKRRTNVNMEMSSIKEKSGAQTGE